MEQHQDYTGTIIIILFFVAASIITIITLVKKTQAPDVRQQAELKKDKIDKNKPAVNPHAKGPNVKPNKPPLQRVNKQVGEKPNFTTYKNSKTKDQDLGPQKFGHQGCEEKWCNEKCGYEECGYGECKEEDKKSTSIKNTLNVNNLVEPNKQRVQKPLNNNTPKKEDTLKNEEVTDSDNEGSHNEGSGYKMRRLSFDLGELNPQTKEQENNIQQQEQKNNRQQQEHKNNIKPEVKTSPQLQINSTTLNQQKTQDVLQQIKNPEARKKILQCPICRQYIEFEGGCYFITCRSNYCEGRKYFCYVCQRRVEATDKTIHFPRGIYAEYCINTTN